MNVTMPDGTVVNNVPDGTTKAQLAQKLSSAGHSVPKEWMAPAAPKTPPSLSDQVEHTAGMTGRTFAEALGTPVTGTLDVASDAGRTLGLGALSQIPIVGHRLSEQVGKAIPKADYTGQFERGLTEMGFPEPKTTTEKVTQGVAQYGLPVGAAGYGAAKLVKPAIKASANFIKDVRGKESSEAVKKAVASLSETARGKISSLKSVADIAKEHAASLGAKGNEAKIATGKAVASARPEVVEALGRTKYQPSNLADIGKSMQEKSVAHETVLTEAQKANKLQLQSALRDEVRNLGKVQDNYAYKNAMASLDSVIKNDVAPTNKALIAKLGAVKKDLESAQSFEVASDTIKNLRDKAYEIGGTGYSSKLQKVADQFNEALKKYSPAYEKLTTAYPELDKPLEVFETKAGKATTAKTGGFKGEAFHAVNPEDVPKKVFESPTNYQDYIKSVGGDKKFAEEMAKKYFTNEVRGMDSQKAASFLEKHREVLDQMPEVRASIEKEYIDPMKNFEQTVKSHVETSVARNKVIEGLAKKRAITQAQATKVADNLASDMRGIDNPNNTSTESLKKAESLVLKLRDNELISDEQMNTILKDIGEAEKKYGNTVAAKQHAHKAAQAAMTMGAAALGAGSAGWWLYKVGSHGNY